ncbi:MAG: branched-chain amino acid ABC transporter permease [Actinomycetota bacterium]|nr:branched-chain amino acid ABC transporter permease [Actinomycetota bacterium]
MGYYISSLTVYWIIGSIAGLGLNLQFGVAGILNFAFVLFQATGAYVAAMLSLGPDTSYGGFQKYIVGMHLPFPLPLLGGVLAAGLLSLVVGAVGLRKLRRDYQAMVMLVMSVIATTIAQGDTGLVNGTAGLALVPRPFSSLAPLSPTAFGFAFVALSAAFLLITYALVYRITESPWGRVVRAARDNEAAAGALGKNVVSLHLTVFVIGGMIAGLSGVLLVQFIGAWAPPGWYYPETFVFFTAVIVGGTGNRLGVLLGTLLIGVLIGQGSTYLPQFGPTPVFVASMQWVVIGLAILGFLWFRPEGVLPERIRRLRKRP